MDGNIIYKESGFGKEWSQSIVVPIALGTFTVAQIPRKSLLKSRTQIVTQIWPKRPNSGPNRDLRIWAVGPREVQMHKSQNQIPFRIGLKSYMFSCYHVGSNLRYLRRDLGAIWAYCERP